MVDTLTEPMPPPRWWYFYVTAGGGIAVLALIVGLFGLWSNDRNAARQAECFASFAARFSNVSKEVREAQVHVDEVEENADASAARRDAAFQRVLTYVVAGEKDRTEALERFTRLTAANQDLVRKRRALVKARNHLQAVRKQHPIPDAPTKAGRCTLIKG
jgi:hypothetical protein